jgi:hypothetical protein
MSETTLARLKSLLRDDSAPEDTKELEETPDRTNQGHDKPKQGQDETPKPPDGRRRKWDANDYAIRGILPPRPVEGTDSLKVRVNRATKTWLRDRAAERRVTIGDFLDELVAGLAEPS